MLVTSQSVYEENLQVTIFLVWAEPGSGGCLDALNPRHSLLMARRSDPQTPRGGAIRAPRVPRKRKAQATPTRSGSQRGFSESRQRDAAPQTPLRMDGWCAGLDSHSLHLRF